MQADSNVLNIASINIISQPNPKSIIKQDTRNKTHSRPIFASLKLYESADQSQTNKSRSDKFEYVTKPTCTLPRNNTIAATSHYHTAQPNYNHCSSSKLDSSLSSCNTARPSYTNQLEISLFDSQKSKFPKKLNSLYEEAHRFDKKTANKVIPRKPNIIKCMREKTKKEICSLNNSFRHPTKCCRRFQQNINKSFKSEATTECTFKPTLLAQYSKKSTKAVSIIKKISLNTITLTSQELSTLKEKYKYKEKEILRNKCRLILSQSSETCHLCHVLSRTMIKPSISYSHKAKQIL